MGKAFNQNKCETEADPRLGEETTEALGYIGLGNHETAKNGKPWERYISKSGVQ